MVNRIINKIRGNSRIKKSDRKGGVNEMKKYLFIAVLGIAMATVSLAAQAGIIIEYDLSSLGLKTTGTFDRQTLATVDATSTYANGMYPGAPFTDVGDLKMGTFTLSGNPLSNDQNLNSSWELTGHWDNLAGTLTTIDTISTGTLSGTLYSFIYTSGNAFLYGGTALDANFGSGIGSGDDTVSTFIDGTQFAALSLSSGQGTLFIPSDGSAPTGSTAMSWKITSVPAGVWLDQHGTDLKTILEEYGYADINTIVGKDVTIEGGGYPGSTILSRNTGDVTYVVPEPTTMLLLGSGLLCLLGIAGVRRKKA